MAEKNGGASIPGLTNGGLMMAVGTIIATYAWLIDNKYDQRMTEMRVAQETMRMQNEQNLEDQVYKARRELADMIVMQKEDWLRIDAEREAHARMLTEKIDSLTRTVIEMGANLNNLFSKGKR